MWCPLSEWVICQSHRHGNRIEKKATRRRTTGIRSSSWFSDLGCLALNSRRKVQMVLVDTASRSWVTRAVGGYGHLLPSHKEKQVIMCLPLQKANGRQNLSWQNYFFVSPLQAKLQLFNTLPCDNFNKSFSWLVQLNPLCSCGQRVRKTLVQSVCNCSAALSLLMCEVPVNPATGISALLCLLLMTNEN